MPTRQQYFSQLGISKEEERRIVKTLKEVGVVAGAGVRGSSPRNVIRTVLQRVGSDARKALRRRTPVGRRPLYPVGRRPLKQTVRGGVGNPGRNGNVLYRAGYSREFFPKEGPGRFQQTLAVEHGTELMRGRAPISDALSDAVGPRGERYKREFVKQFDKRIGQLFAKANAKARANVRNAR